MSNVGGMTDDPRILHRGAKDARLSHLELRACQYAAAMARRFGALRRPMGAYVAAFDGKDTVLLRTYGQEVHFVIPAHVLEFDPNAPARREDVDCKS